MKNVVEYLLLLVLVSVWSLLGSTVEQFKVLPVLQSVAPPYIHGLALDWVRVRLINYSGGWQKISMRLKDGKKQRLL